MKEILPNIHLLNLGSVNAYLITQPDVILIDTGSPGQADKIVSYLAKIGLKLEDINHILLTHLHPDHSGNAAYFKQACKAKIYLHKVGVDEAEEGNGMIQKMSPSKGVLSNIIWYGFVRNVNPHIEAFKVDHPLKDGDRLPVGKGFQVRYVPGHDPSQTVFLYEDQGGILFGADTVANFTGLSPFPCYANHDQAKQDFKTIGALTFDKLVIGHGSPILKNADQVFRKKILKGS
ncbi:MAG: MBL fold metallo-hydrolase [Bacteroidota bacterium]